MYFRHNTSTGDIEDLMVVWDEDVAKKKPFCLVFFMTYRVTCTITCISLCAFVAMKTSIVEFSLLQGHFESSWGESDALMNNNKFVGLFICILPCDNSHFKQQSFDLIVNMYVTTKKQKMDVTRLLFCNIFICILWTFSYHSDWAALYNRNNIHSNKWVCNEITDKPPLPELFLTLISDTTDHLYFLLICFKNLIRWVYVFLDQGFKCC